MNIRLGLSALALAALAVVVQAQETSTTYRDPVNGFSLNLPVFEPVTSGGSQVLTVAGPQVGGFSPNCNVQIQIMDGNLDAYEKLSLGQFEQAGVDMIAADRITVSGHPAIRWHYTGEMRGIAFEWLAVVTMRSNRFYLLTCTARRSDFAATQSAFEAAISSFEVE